MESHKGLFNLEVQAVSSVHTQVKNCQRHTNSYTVAFLFTLSPCLFLPFRLLGYTSIHRQLQVHCHSAITPPGTTTPIFSQYICFFFVSFFIPLLLYFSLLPVQVSHCNKSFLSCTRTTTWSVSSPSAMHWRVELHSHCGSERRRFWRTSWSMN